jgi:hypothetical protein
MAGYFIDCCRTVHWSLPRCSLSAAALFAERCRAVR